MLKFKVGDMFINARTTYEIVNIEPYKILEMVSQSNHLIVFLRSKNGDVNINYNSLLFMFNNGSCKYIENGNCVQSWRWCQIH